MKEYVRCKSCGFVMLKGQLHDKCPACGVAAIMFEPFDDKVSEKRKFILSLDIHPVLVHFPQSFISLFLILTVLLLFVEDTLKDNLLATAKVIGLLLPFVVLIAFIAGLIDGKIRFKRFNTQILIKKIIFGSLFFIFSAIIFILLIVNDLSDIVTIYLSLAASICAFICSAVLGRLGSSLINSKFPG